MSKSETNLTGKATVSAKVTRADGTVEDLGEIAGVSVADSNALITLLKKIKDKVSK